MAELAIDEYLDTTRSLWPSGPAPELRRSRSGGAGRVEMIVLPNRATPRLLVPAGSPRAAAGAMLRFSAALTPGDTAKRVAVAASLRLGARRLYPDRITVADDRESLGAHLASTVFGHDVELSLGLGTARANRKPVLQAFDPRGRSVAFVKLGINDRSKADVGGEAAALRRLAEVGSLDGMEVPTLLHDGHWGETRVVVMSALNTSMWQRPSKDPHPPTRAMQVLHDAFHEGRIPLVESPVWQRLLLAATAVTDPEAQSRLTSALERLADLAGGRPLPIGAWHGDWTPWNMARRRRRVQLWDWERFETGVPHGLDVCHYGVNTITRRDGIKPSSVRTGLSSVGFTHASIDDERAVVAGTYLATIASRYLLSSQLEHGERIMDASWVMLDSLCSWVGLPDRATDRR